MASDDTLPDIPPEITGEARAQLERIRRTDPWLFPSSLKTALNVLDKEAPRSFRPHDEPPEDESDGWHP